VRLVTVGTPPEAKMEIKEDKEQEASISASFLFGEEQDGTFFKAPATLPKTGEYLLDEGGWVVRLDGGESGEKTFYPTIYLEEASRFERGERALPQEAVGQILLLQKTFEAYAYLPTLQYFYIPGGGLFDEVVMYTKKGGYRIYVSLELSLQNQVNYLVLMLQRIAESKEVGELKYIDLRIEDRAYVCCTR
jgi:hypothetical protein